MDKVWLTVEELAYKYPSSLHKHSWYRHLRQWRESGELTTPASWITRDGGSDHPSTFYWETKVLKLIYENRHKPGFCNLIFYKHQEAIVRNLREFTQSVRR